MTLTLCLTQGNPVLSKHHFLECTDFAELLHNLFFTFIIAEYILDAKPLVANLKPQGSLTFSIHLYCSYGSHSASDLMSDVQFPKHTIFFFPSDSTGFWASLSDTALLPFFFFERVTKSVH